MFWVLCTGCFVRPGGAGRKFYMASCSHMFCEQCVNLSVPFCKRCRTTVILTLCDSNMPPDLKLLFSDPKEKMLSVMKGFDYQLNSMHGLISHFRHSAEKQAYIKNYAEQVKNELDKCKQNLDAYMRKYKELEIAHESLKRHIRKTRLPTTTMTPNPAATPSSHGWLSQLGLENPSVSQPRTSFSPANRYSSSQTRNGTNSPITPTPQRPSPIHSGLLTPTSSLSSSFYRSPRYANLPPMGQSKLNSFGSNNRF